MRKSKVLQDKKISILTLDDDPIITSTIQSYFMRSGYFVDVENDPMQAIERIKVSSYDILLLDFLMSPIHGDEVVREVRKFNKNLFIILLTGHKSMAPPVKTIRELDIQGYFEKNERFDQLELLVESCVKSIRQMRIINEYKDDLSKAYMQTIDTLRNVVETRDKETKGHSERVSALASVLAEEMGLSAEVVEKIRVAGLFHDIGKIGVKDSILLKNGSLTNDEFEEIKRHPTEGEHILTDYSPFKDLLSIIRHHHERYDGRGYPDGLKGEEICLGARIIAVADSFDAMISNRAYRKGLGFDATMAEIERCKGAQFDPIVVDALYRLIDRLGKNEFLSRYCSNS
jgi:putative nucleotidyltransferase with HDIG domain